MKIGVDLSPLQSGSRMRGIGYALINILNNLSPEAKKSNMFVFYIEENDNDPLKLIDLSGIHYETKTLTPYRPLRAWPGRMRILSGTLNKIGLAAHQWFGSRRFKNVHGIDAFLQVDQASGLPGRRIPSLLIIFDIIPLVMEREYIWSYHTARQHGRTRKGALVSSLDRFTYYLKVKIVVGRAHKLLTSSHWTKEDYVKYLHVKPDRIGICELGVNPSKPGKTSTRVPPFEMAVESPWGYVSQPVDLTEKPFLLFVGGADPRRRLVELIAAYNNLKAQKHDIRLVLAGDSMQSPKTIANPALQEYLNQSNSYTEDLIFAGFVSDEQREWLYSHALAFVFPSVYEGFGLPVLEAMEKGCPVISYLNTSIREVAGDAVLPAKNYEDIMQQTLALINDKSLRQTIIQKGRQQAAKFTWRQTTDTVMRYLAESVKQ